MGERTEAPPVADEARRASEKIRSIATKWARYDYIFEWAMKNPIPATKKIPRTCSEDIFLPLHFSLFTLHFSPSAEEFFWR